jgi:hypothetical protein
MNGAGCGERRNLVMTGAAERAYAVHFNYLPHDPEKWAPVSEKIMRKRQRV